MKELRAMESWFETFVPARLAALVPRSRRVARGVAIRNRQIWMAERRNYATQDLDRLRPDLAGVERARAIRRHARALVAAGDEIALGWIRRARTR
jgi:hypothetical protein